MVTGSVFGEQVSRMFCFFCLKMRLYNVCMKYELVQT
jgi:hypothetical protein